MSKKYLTKTVGENGEVIETAEKQPGKIKVALENHPKVKKALDTAKKVAIGVAAGAAAVGAAWLIHDKNTEDGCECDCDYEGDFEELDETAADDGDAMPEVTEE